jgi:hypothetical protein
MQSSWPLDRQDRSGFAPIEAGMRDHNFNAGEEQGKKTDSGDPVSDAHEGKVPRCKLCEWGG